MNYKFAGCDTVELANKYSTPLYVMDEDMIVDNIKTLKNSFDNKYKNAMTYYASKAFLTKDMLRIVKEQNIGLDVASGGELYLAEKMGFPADKVMFHGNAKDIQEIEQGVLFNVGRFICDSMDEIRMINKIAKKHNKVQNILIRVTPGVDSDTHKYIQTAGIKSKFGVPISIIEEVVKEVITFENVDLKGFHFHIGSQLHSNKSHLMACEILLNLIKNVKDKFNYEIKNFNLGGGFGVRYTENDSPIEPSEFIDPMVELIENFCSANDLLRPKLFIEPGRWIVANAGITIYTINSVKENPDIITYISVDGGMTDNLRPALYEAKYEAVIANKMYMENTDLVTIAGKCCESSDILIEDIKLPKAEWGDILVVKTTGAYHHSLANNYNKNRIPPVIMIKDSVARVSVKRETFDDIYINNM